ncbi:MAG: hypothetical protein RJB38_1688 [Pseudomonadota bacterium]|jgi:hypothetical protein
MPKPKNVAQISLSPALALWLMTIGSIGLLPQSASAMGRAPTQSLRTVLCGKPGDSEHFALVMETSEDNHNAIQGSLVTTLQGTTISCLGSVTQERQGDATQFTFSPSTESKSCLRASFSIRSVSERETPVTLWKLDSELPLTTFQDCAVYR